VTVSEPQRFEKVQRSLGFWRSWSLVVGGTIGSSVFMMPAVLAPYGTVGLASLVFATFGAVCLALTFGALARRVTVSGGLYAYTRAAFGDFLAFIVAWNYWIGIWVSCAALAIGFIAYVGVAVPIIGSHPVLGSLCGLMLIWTLVSINIMGVRESGIVSLISTILKLTPIALVGIVGLRWIDVDDFPVANFGETNSLVVFASIFALSFWNFIGIECATVPAENTVDPTRVIPRAVLVGTLTVGAIYLLIMLVSLGAIPATSLAASSSPLADVGARLFGGFGGTLIVAGAIVSVAGCLNVSVLAGGQVAMAAGRDRLFPSSLARLSARHTPWISYVLVGALASLLLVLSLSRGLVAAYQFILLMATLTTVISYAIPALAALFLQFRNPGSSKANNWNALAAVIGFGVCLWVVASSGAETIYWVILLTLLGLPIYFVPRRKNRSLSLSGQDSGASTVAPVNRTIVPD
jgi:APA family basic amino acid/polyamine antiporter